MHHPIREPPGRVETCDRDEVGVVDTTAFHVGVFCQLHGLVRPGMVHNERLQYLLPELPGPELCGGATSVEGIIWESFPGTSEVIFWVYRLDNVMSNISI